MKFTGFKRRGFTLVVTVSLMVLLAVVAVGLLSLASIELRKSGQGDAMAVARKNARLGMMLAVGELQKHAGSDQRVTATSSVLGTEVENASWVGVWRTDGLKSDATPNPLLRADTRSGTGYTDRRSQTPAYTAESECLAWLVSGEQPNPKSALTGEGAIDLRSGSVPVRVSKVAVGGRTNGAYAFHVSDESTKAKVSLADPYLTSQPDAANPEGDGMKRWLAPQSTDTGVFFKGTPLTAEQAEKTISARQLELTSLAGGQSPEELRELVRTRGDHFTVHGLSVLSDPVEGGLKGDLTAFLEDNKAPALGKITAITDTTAINGRLGASRTRSGPKFGMLRNWYQLRNSVTKSAGGHVLENQRPNASSQGKISIVDPGSGYVKPLIQPVMTEACYYLNHVLDGGGTASTRITELIYPRVVLWNPFSVKLKTTGHVVLFDFLRNHTIRATYRTASGGTGEKQISYNTNGQRDQMPGFQIPPTEFAPGEALVFCAPTQNRAFNGGDLRANTLSATASPADLGFFTRAWPNNDLGAGIDPNSVELEYVFNGNVYWNNSQIDGRTQTITLHAPTGSSPVTAANLLTGGGPVAVRQMSLDNFSRGNNGRWLPSYTKRNIRRLSDVTAGRIPPDSLLAYGGRFRFLYETYSNRVHGQPFNEPWYYSPLAHHNINAPNIHRWPNDNIFGLQYNAVSGTGGFGPHLYAYGVIAQARQWSEWLDPEVMPRRSASGAFRTAVFADASFASSDSVYPVYDIPLPGAPLVSIGALQHAPLSPFAWHPTHAVGNSIPSPFVPMANSTSERISDETSLWSSKAATLSSSNDITGFDRVANEVLLNDLSYELNQALWDRFFLSAIPRAGGAWKGDKWDPSAPLPNSRLKVNPALSGNGSRTELHDFHKAARALWLDGGFNIHSTSVDAWRSLLRSFRDVDVPTGSGQPAGGGGAAFPGHIVSNGSASTTALDASRGNFWRDYRKLSDKEIDDLALAIVTQVRKRAPFVGVSDFVNRRLAAASDSLRRELAFGGVIQTALDLTKAINDSGSRNADLMMPRSAAATNFSYGAPYWGGPIATPDPQKYETFHLVPGGDPRPEGAGAASQITQADILQQIGPVLVARGDTFVIRAYGEAHDGNGIVSATAWCEAVVQRTPVPVNPDPASNGLNPKIETGKTDWGRQFVIQSFRWLDPREI